VLGESADEGDWVCVSKATVTNEPYGYLSGSRARVHRVPVEIWATNVRARSARVGVGKRTSYSGSGVLPAGRACASSLIISEG
jgi:hypothetical protein